MVLISLDGLERFGSNGGHWQSQCHTNQAVDTVSKAGRRCDWAGADAGGLSE